MHASESEGPKREGRLLGNWKGRLQEFMSARGIGRWEGLEQDKRECLDRKKWRSDNKLIWT